MKFLDYIFATFSCWGLSFILTYGTYYWLYAPIGETPVSHHGYFYYFWPCWLCAIFIIVFSNIIYFSMDKTL